VATKLQQKKCFVINSITNSNDIFSDWI